MKFKQVDYKGKWFVLQDCLFDSMDEEIGEMDYKDITDRFLLEHVTACDYYGIPSYIGKNKELNDRTDKMQFLIREDDKK